MAAFRGIHAANGGAESTTVVIRTPGGTVIGDVLIAGVMIDGAKVEPTISGWTKLGQVNTTTGEVQTFAVFWKIATEGGEKLHTVEWGGAKRYNAGVILAIKEADGTTPVFDSQMKSNTTSSTSMKFAQATVPAASSCSVLFGAIDQTGTGTPPTNWTERSDNTIGTYVATRDNPPVEKLAEQTVTLSAARITNTAHIIVQPTVEAAKVSEGQAKGKAKFTATAKGVRERLGKALGVTKLKALIGGLRERKGVAAGTVTFAAVAGGQVTPASEVEEPEGVRMDYGFLRDESRRLVVATEGEGHIDQGFLRDEEGALLVATEGEGAFDQGLLRDDERRLLIATEGEGAIDQGFLKDSEGRLLVTTEATGAHMDQGFLKSSDGHLVVVGI